jgi:hypothetical protein
LNLPAILNNFSLKYCALFHCGNEPHLIAG